MIKKLSLVAITVFTFFHCNAQFLNSIAITGGGSLGNEKFYFLNPSTVAKKKYILGANASIFAEFFSGNYVRWVSELQYNEKGSVDKASGGPYINKLQYGCWNNYLKFRYEMYRIIPYVLIGPRLEYDITQATASPAITGRFLPLHISAAAGAGIEFVSYGNFKFFTEAFYNPDIIMPAYLRSGLDVRNKNIELRIGLKYQFGGRTETCNTPTYVE
jgi:hypothetical protein